MGSWELRQLQSLSQPPVSKVKPKLGAFCVGKHKRRLPSPSGLKTKPWVSGSVRRACIPLGPVKESKVAQVDSALGLWQNQTKIFLEEDIPTLDLRIVLTSINQIRVQDQRQLTLLENKPPGPESSETNKE